MLQKILRTRWESWNILGLIIHYIIWNFHQIVLGLEFVPLSQFRNLKKLKSKRFPLRILSTFIKSVIESYKYIFQRIRFVCS